MEQGGHGPVWQRTEQTCSQPSRGFMHVDAHVGTGSVQAVRVRSVFGGKKGLESGVRACLPQGQCVTIEGERGQGTGVGDGGWQGFEQ